MAQMSAPPITSMLPGVAKMSVANASGVLRYCEKNQLVSVASTDVVLGQIEKRPDLTSAEYIAGQSGQILGDGGKNFSLSRAPGYLQSQGCNLVLERAKKFVPAH
jgi:hypothetical protein